MKKLIVVLIVLLIGCAKPVNYLDVTAFMMASPHSDKVVYYEVRNNSFETVTVSLLFEVYTDRKIMHWTECKTYHAGQSATESIEFDTPVKNAFYIKTKICKQWNIVGI
jgi:hypothetical protein